MISMDDTSKSMAKSAKISAIITRADGTVENVGTIAYWHRNPLKRWAWSLNRIIKTWRSK
jgi:hypothetical protein